MRVLVSFFSILFFFYLLLPPVYAQDKASLPVITIVNPIRGNELGLEKIDLLSSLQAQFKVTGGLPAAWLWQYSALENDQLINFAKSEMKGQEFGLFLEVDRNFAEKSGVQYRGQGPWYFSDGIFLVSYDVDERRRLIDEQFSLFKRKFGYYPKTVGAWWIGADSLTYMQQKYGIVAALKAADQYDLDVYSFLGSPWSIPYVASKHNEGIPASKENSSHVVILQWAARDPGDGYKDATYSVQDFHLKQYEFSYLDHLFPLFLKEPLDNIVIGLENGGDLAGFESSYGKYIQKAKEYKDAGKVDILLAKDYAEKFLSQKKAFSANRYILSKAYQSDDGSFWYNSENFRAGIHKVGNDIYIIDLKKYSEKIKEEFAVLPNSQGYFRTTTPSLIDSMRMPGEKIRIAANTGTLSFEEKDNTVTLLSGNKKIAYFTNSSLEIFLDNNTSRLFNFQPNSSYINMVAVLLGLYLLYFIVVLFHTKNLRRSFLQFCPLFIPLLLAYPFLSSGILGDHNILFDRKHLWLLPLLQLFSPGTLYYGFFMLQLFPLIVLLTWHYFFILRKAGKSRERLYYILFGCIILFYAHVSYFPLDISTYPLIAAFLLFVTLIGITVSIVIFRKTRAKKILLVSLASIPVLLTLIVSVIYISRTTMILTPFEIGALKVIKEKNKDVIFVSQTNYGLRPIYKAVKPLLYENYRFGGSITGTKWTITEKTESSKLDITGYNDKLIFVPRYLGADLAVDEQKRLKVKKIFDNGQIALFEKE